MNGRYYKMRKLPTKYDNFRHNSAVERKLSEICVDSESALNDVKGGNNHDFS